MNKTIMEFNNVGNHSILGTIVAGTLSQNLNRWRANIRGKEYAYLNFGDKIRMTIHELVWKMVLNILKIDRKNTDFIYTTHDTQ